MISAEVAAKILGVIMAMYNLLANYIDLPSNKDGAVEAEIKSWLDTITK